ncbi:MAG: hypothetical protein EOO36_22040 [Cytophagaceae bacterium]|nr:MAG: hypothetical protein EOO36_22040 [Cytophagaceae bacterium]
MSTTRSEQDQATQPVQSDDYQPTGRQEAPTNSDALYGGNADDNSGSGGNAGPSTTTPEVPAYNEDGTPATAAKKSPIEGPGVSGGSAASGTSSGEVTL